MKRVSLVIGSACVAIAAVLFYLLQQPVSPPKAREPDIIEYAATHPCGAQRVQQADGSWKESKYGDHELAAAETYLTPIYPRPWTVPQAIDWYRAATDDAVRVHLLRLLAASRDPRAALVLGEGRKSESLSIRVAAYTGLDGYFLGEARTMEGGLEQIIHNTDKWFDANKARLLAEAARK